MTDATNKFVDLSITVITSHTSTDSSSKRLQIISTFTRHLRSSLRFLRLFIITLQTDIKRGEERGEGGGEGGDNGRRKKRRTKTTGEGRRSADEGDDGAGAVGRGFGLIMILSSILVFLYPDYKL